MRITIADDDKNMLTIVEDILQRAFPQARLVSFQAPRAALEHIQTNGTEFVVTNHGMGEMSGTELIKLLRAHDVRIPIIMISSNPDVRSEAMEAGADDFVDKLHMEILPAVIRSHLVRRRDS